MCILPYRGKYHSQRVADALAHVEGQNLALDLAELEESFQSQQIRNEIASKVWDDNHEGKDLAERIRNYSPEELEKRA